MEDKILDDDIIDLTDLLEEGQPPGERKESGETGDAAAGINEPDSFDLGKEISMEYDVSVEEIEGGSENLDIDAALSSNEEEALAADKIGDEDTIVLEDAGESLEIDLAEDSSAPAPEPDLSSVEEQVLSQETSDTPQPVAEQDFSGEVEMDALESEPAAPEQEEATFDMGEVLTEEAAEEVAVVESTEEVSAEAAPEEDVVPQANTDDVIAEIRQEIPNMIEGIVRPFMTELVHEIIAASREQLPGIVEKIIREEIDKLKKLDS